MNKKVAVGAAIAALAGGAIGGGRWLNGHRESGVCSVRLPDGGVATLDMGLAAQNGTCFDWATKVNRP